LASRKGLAGKSDVEEALRYIHRLEYDDFVYASTIRAFSELDGVLTAAVSEFGVATRKIILKFLHFAMAEFQEWKKRSR
jgi:hypothetical protein